MKFYVWVVLSLVVMGSLSIIPFYPLVFAPGAFSEGNCTTEALDRRRLLSSLESNARQPDNDTSAGNCRITGGEWGYWSRTVSAGCAGGLLPEELTGTTDCTSISGDLVVRFLNGTEFGRLNARVISLGKVEILDGDGRLLGYYEPNILNNMVRYTVTTYTIYGPSGTQMGTISFSRNVLARLLVPGRTLTGDEPMEVTIHGTNVANLTMSLSSQLERQMWVGTQIGSATFAQGISSDTQVFLTVLLMGLGDKLTWRTDSDGRRVKPGCSSAFTLIVVSAVCGVVLVGVVGGVMARDKIMTWWRGRKKGSLPY